MRNMQKTKEILDTDKSLSPVAYRLALIKLALWKDMEKKGE